jgi:hypothetical protein
MANFAPARPPITLGEANNNLLDLTDNNQIKMYRNGMKFLEGDKYDGKPKGLRVFLESFKNRAIMYNWFDVLTVPNLARTDAKNFLTHYGSITMEECVSHAEDYMLARDRASQNSQMMFHCLSDSLTTEFKAELMSEAGAYTIDGYSEGLCFLKMITSKAQIDTVATVNVLRASIGKLSIKMVEMSGNITEFNNYARNLDNTLKSYGETSPELMMNLFAAYEAVEDEKFNIYIGMKRNQWEEGALQGLTTNVLMTNAENYYKVRVQQEKWQAPTKKDEQILALKALLKEKEQTRNDGNGKQGKKSREEKARVDKERHPWKYIAPKEGDSNTKEVSGFTWYWCSKHNKWGGHKETDCRGVGAFTHKGKNVAYPATNGSDNTSTAASTVTTPSVQVNKAYMSLSDDGSLFD